MQNVARHKYLLILRLGFENVAQGGKMPDVEGGVVEKFRRDGALGPIGFLARLIDGDAEVFFEEAGEADALAAEELGGAMTEKLAELFSENARPKVIAKPAPKKRARA